MQKMLKFALCTAWVASMTASPMTNTANIPQRYTLAQKRTELSPEKQSLLLGATQKLVTTPYAVMAADVRVHDINNRLNACAQHAARLVNAENTDLLIEIMQARTALYRLIKKVMVDPEYEYWHEDYEQDLDQLFKAADLSSEEARLYLQTAQEERNKFIEIAPNSYVVANLSNAIERLQKIAEQKEAVDADSLIADDAQDQAEKEVTQPSSSEQA